MEEQRKEMSSFTANFNQVQEQQLNTMNSLLGALTNFLKNNNNWNSIMWFPVIKFLDITYNFH